LRNIGNRKRTALVTGGAGFIGSNLVRRLLQNGMTVVVLDDFSSGTTCDIPGGAVEFVRGDVRNIELVETLIQKSDIVFHLAEYIPNTRSSGPGHVVKYSVEHPLLEFDVSCKGTLSVLEGCRMHDKAIVFASTAAVYGECETGSLKESTPISPRSPYGASKACAETYVKLYWQLYRVPSTTLRLFNVYGPRQYKYLAYDILTRLEEHPVKLEVLGSGNEERDFVFIDDVVDAMLLVANRRECNGECYNVGTGISSSVKRVVETILEILNERVQLVFTQNSWRGDVRRLVANIDKIGSIGFEPRHSLREGLTRLIEWHRTERSKNGT
jgi:UDP-glucose 4-epimerase